MSDFERILTAPSQAALEALLWPWTKRLLRKWLTTGLTEEEGRQMLLIWSQKRVETSEMRQRRREISFETSGNPSGLQWASIVFEKDIRTINRWCSKGLFPGAVRTEGGHWRIPLRVVEQVRNKHPGGFGRGARRLFGTRIWNEFKEDFLKLWCPRLIQAFDMEAALRDASEVEYRTKPTTPSDEALDKLKIVEDTHQSMYLALRNLARRLYKENPSRPLNYQHLADALKVHPSTLYRRCGKKAIRSAVKAASKPLKKRESEMKADDEKVEACDAKHLFNEIVVEANIPSPYIGTSAVD